MKFVAVTANLQSNKECIIPISLDTPRSLDANKSYYVAYSSGEINEATTWQKFKYFLGIGDGRAKAAKVVDAVKSALLEASGKINDSTLNLSIKSLESKRSRFFSISGRDFASRAATSRLGPQTSPPPTRRRAINEEAFKADLEKVLDDTEQVIVYVSKAGPEGRSRFDGAVCDAIFSTLYGPDGKRNDKTVADMPSISELHFNKVMDNAITHKPSEVTKDEFAALVRTLINECGEAPDMLDAYRV